jgi:hypothetical protein
VGTLKEIVFECDRPATLARLWAQALQDYQIRPYDAAEIARLAALGLTPETDPTVLVDGPGPSLCFQRVADRRYENNRVHVDVAAADVNAEVARLCGCGATVQRTAAKYVVLCDPEGNQFCVVAADAYRAGAR